MRAGTAELIAHEQSGKPSYFVDLYVFTLVDGTVMRWSGGEVPLAWQDKPYVLGPLIKRGSVRYTLGLQTDTLDLTFFPDDSTFKAATPASGPVPIVTVPPVGAVPLRQALLRGDFDGATVELYRGIAAKPLKFIGSVQEGEAISLAVGGQTLTVAGNELVIARAVQSTWPLLDVQQRFVGKLGRITGGGFSVSVPARSALSVLGNQWPRNVYQPGCGNTLFDAVCGLNPASYQVSGSVTTVTGQMSFNANALTQAADHFRLGVLRFTNGQNAGRRYMVQTHTAGGGIVLARPPVAPLNAGDTFVILPGCDKRQATCSSKFNNLARFRGMPYVPQPSTTL